jgi:hypothetical protein
MRAGLTGRRGAALALILWILVVGATMLSIGALVGLQEQRAENAATQLRHAFADADAGLGDLVRQVRPGVAATTASPLDSTTLAGTTMVDRPWRGTIRRLGGRTLLLEVSAGAGARVRLGRLAWLRPPEANPKAALSVGGTAWLGTDVVVSGRDSSVGAPDCPSGDSAVAGVVAGALTTAPGVILEGVPPVALRAAAESGLSAEDQAIFDRLWALATTHPLPGEVDANPDTVGPVCNQSASTNWGDPENRYGACASYRPAVAVSGDVSLSGVGQGILLVDGNLSIPGGFRFDGLVMTTGGLSIGASMSPVEIFGAVAAGRVGDGARPVSLVTIRYSKCSIDNALMSVSEIVPLPSRGWKQLF